MAKVAKKKARTKDVDPRQMHLQDPLTKEAINAPYKNKEIDELVIKHSKTQKRLTALKEQADSEWAEVTDAYNRHLDEINQELGGEMYVSVDADNHPIGLVVAETAKKLKIRKLKVVSKPE